MRTLRLAVPLAALLALGPPAAAGPGETVIDPAIDARLHEEGVSAAAAADDATLLRRLTLDLAGRIPTPAEVTTYLADHDPAKRVKLVDRLLASPGYVRHQAAELDALLMAGTRGSV